MTKKPKIEFKEITKIFGNNIANNKISFKVKTGEIHALIGENGAGKSTLMSILFGLYKKTFGLILIDGIEQEINSPIQATSLKLGMVHQHFKLVGIYNAVNNIVLGKEPNKLGFLIVKKAKDKIKKLAKLYKFDINLKIPVEKMSIGMQQKVEILKMLYSDADVLIFDEPTAVLTPKEIIGFLDLLKNFQKQGKTIIIITHKLEEIKKVADKATVIRKGKVVKTNINVKKTSISTMAQYMVGRDLKVVKNKRSTSKLKEIISLQNISIKKSYSNKWALDNISFNVKKGEIVAIAGVEGNGQSELAQIITGMIRPKKGKIIFQEKNITKTSPKKNNILGISHIPEDRHKHGIILDETIKENMTLNLFYQRPYSYYGFLNNTKRKLFANHVITSFDVRGVNKEYSTIRLLSGGNQQKAIIGREMLKDHTLLVAMQPTRGLDVGAIEYIHSQILKEKKNEKAVILISYELEEILDLADRVIVLNDGKITGIVSGKNINKEKIGTLMASSGGINV